MEKEEEEQGAREAWRFTQRDERHGGSHRGKRHGGSYREAGGMDERHGGSRRGMSHRGSHREGSMEVHTER